MRSSHLTILGWHNVSPTPFFPGRPDVFADQLAAILRVANIVPLGPSLDDLFAGRPLPARAVAITFDDGYRDNAEIAVPIMRRLGIPATFFLVPGFLDRTARCWWETIAWAVGGTARRDVEWRGRVLPAGRSSGGRATAGQIAGDLKRDTHAVRNEAIDDLVAQLRPGASEDEVAELFTDWAGARRLADYGAIGSHTNEHPILSRETAAYQRVHLATSRQQLESRLSVPVNILAYPNGTVDDYGPATIDAARAAGYSAAVTTRDGANGVQTPPFEIRRFVVTPRWWPDTARFLLRFLVVTGRGRVS